MMLEPADCTPVCTTLDSNFYNTGTGPGRYVDDSRSLAVLESLKYSRYSHSTIRRG